jgi:hypothetical protein
MGHTAEYFGVATQFVVVSHTLHLSGERVIHFSDTFESYEVVPLQKIS